MVQPFDSSADATLDPKTVESMMVAYELVSRSLHDNTNRRPEVVRQVIVRRILQRAKAGEREPVALARGVLRLFGFDDSDLFARGI